MNGFLTLTSLILESLPDHKDTVLSLVVCWGWVSPLLFPRDRCRPETMEQSTETETELREALQERASVAPEARDSVYFGSEFTSVP